LLQVSDPNTVKELMRHMSLSTTSRYMRTVPDRLKQTVQNLGATPGGNSGDNSLRKNTEMRTLIEQ